MLRQNVLAFFYIINIAYATIEKPSDCGKYDEDWRISTCASSLRQQGLISKAQFNTYLSMAQKKQANPHTTYYSVGFTTGTHKYLVGGCIHEPVFERSMAITYDARQLYHDRVLADLPSDHERPILAFVYGEMPSAPRWEPKTNLVPQTSGNEHYRTVYQIEGASAMTTVPVQNCVALNNWIAEQEVHKWKNIIVLMKPDLWCTVLSESNVQHMIVEFGYVDTPTPAGKEKIYVPEWYVTKATSLGQVPKKFSQVFQ